MVAEIHHGLQARQIKVDYSELVANQYPRRVRLYHCLSLHQYAEALPLAREDAADAAAIVEWIEKQQQEPPLFLTSSGRRA